jgi:hypothetical protein
MFRKTKTRLPYAGLLTTALALAGVGAVGPAYAQTAYDGPWSVVISTRGGACPPSVRFGVQISHGEVINPAPGQAEVRGRVNPRGAVQVNVSAGGQYAVGSGRLGRVSGGGVWRGQGSAGACTGTWVAQRSGGGNVAEAGGGPVYNYAPGARTAAAPGAATCAVRFRSYDPATGTYLGFDGIRHPCR